MRATEVRILPCPLSAGGSLSIFVDEDLSRVDVFLTGEDREGDWIIGVFAHVAQSVERVLGKDEVTGSNPVKGSSLKTTT